MRSAAEFQLVTTPSSDLPTIASSEHSTIAARCRWAPSARLRSVMSWLSIHLHAAVKAGRKRRASIQQ
jgi:hypothetical protein